ncbi:MAG: hypothetical protein H7Z14_11085 [Anaerolineae bacterium]|nr:hypothetical protein [Phycisphaerae bacterium]
MTRLRPERGDNHVMPPLAASQIRGSAIVGAALLPLLFGGCASGVSPAESGITEVATDVDPATTQPSYWLDLAALSVSARDFDRLWSAAQDTARDFGFTVDRMDYRAGLMTTLPLTSGQWFEFWRSDIRSVDDLAESSTATIRRTIRFEFVAAPDGAFKVFPKVLVERQSITEQRITSVVNYQGVFRRPVRTRERPQGTRESDEGVMLPARYWYPTGRDQALEAALIDALKKKTRKSQSS